MRLLYRTFEESKICQTRLQLVRKIAAKDQAEQQATPRANIPNRHHLGAMVLNNVTSSFGIIAILFDIKIFPVPREPVVFLLHRKLLNGSAL